MKLLKVYASHAVCGDVLIRRGNKELFCIFPWWTRSRPTKRNKYVTINCYRWALVWRCDCAHCVSDPLLKGGR